MGSSAEAAAASGICNEAGNEVGETKSAEAPAVVTEETLSEADEMESESPTQPLDQLNEALMEESQDQKDERYVVKATPMTAGSSGLETPPTSSETMNENEVVPEEKPVVVEESIPSVEKQDATNINVTSDNIETEDTPELVEDKAEEAEVVATPATPATPNLNKTT